MKITIHRGSHEIGGNCVDISTNNSRIILDVGMPLFRQDRQPHDSQALKGKSRAELLASGIIPAVPGVFIDGPRPDAILLSHAHEDHTGLLRHTADEIPVYAGRGTSKMMTAGAKFAMQPALPRRRYRELSMKSSAQIGDFRVTPFSVDHSIFGAQAFLIEADGKSILYSGDLRMHGRKPGMHRSLIETVSTKNVDVLLMEGTHIGHTGHQPVSEYELEDKITNLIKTAPGITLASFSPQHVDRLVAIFRATQKSGKTFVADAYTAFVMHLIASETSIPRPESDNSVRVFFPEYFEQTYQRKRLADFYRKMAPARITIEDIRKNPERYVMVFRPSMLDSDFSGQLPDQARCLYSRWTGYLEQPEWKRTKADLDHVNGDLIEVHTTGHIHADDILDFVRQVGPKIVIPIHTFDGDDFAHHFQNAHLLPDGDVFTV